MPFYRLVTWPINHPEQYRAEDVYAVDEAAMGDLAYEQAGYAHGFDFWEVAGPPPPDDPTPKPEPAAESEPVSVPEPESAPKRRRKKGVAPS